MILLSNCVEMWKSPLINLGDYFGSYLRLNTQHSMVGLADSWTVTYMCSPIVKAPTNVHHTQTFAHIQLNSHPSQLCNLQHTIDLLHVCVMRARTVHQRWRLIKISAGQSDSTTQLLGSNFHVGVVKVRYGKWSKKATVDDVDNAIDVAFWMLGHSSVKEEPREATWCVLCSGHECGIKSWPGGGQPLCNTTRVHILLTHNTPASY